MNSKRFNQYRAVVRRSGVADELEAMLRPNGKGGRPRNLSVEVFLTILLASYQAKHDLIFTHVYDFMVNYLDRNTLIECGIANQRGQLLVSQANVILPLGGNLK